VRSVADDNLFQTGNDKLFHELFVEQRMNTTLSNFVFVMLQMPRDQRDYAQSKGNLSLGDALKEIGINNSLTFFRVCKKVEKCPYDA
jgi:hypothetical protein